MGDDAESEIRRVALRRRSRRARQHAARDQAAQTAGAELASRKADSEREQALDALAFGEGFVGMAILSVIALALFAGAMALLFTVAGFAPDQDRLIASTLLTMLAMAITAVLAVGVRGLFARWRRRRLYAIGREFDVEHYMGLLGEKRRAGAVVVTLTWAKPWSEERRRDTADAIREWMSELDGVAWRDDRALVIQSRELDARFADPSGDVVVRMTHHFSNQLLHRWFERAVSRVVTPLDRATPIERIDVDIVGDTYAWDASADQ